MKEFKIRICPDVKYVKENTIVVYGNYDWEWIRLVSVHYNSNVELIDVIYKCVCIKNEESSICLSNIHRKAHNISFNDTIIAEEYTENKNRFFALYNKTNQKKYYFKNN